MRTGTTEGSGRVNEGPKKVRGGRSWREGSQSSTEIEDGCVPDIPQGDHPTKRPVHVAL